MRASIIFLLAGLLFTTGFLGCKYNDVLLDTPGRKVIDRQIDDLYVPKDVLFLDSNELTVFVEEGDFRVFVRWYFRGILNPDKIVMDYIEKMPAQYNWKHLKRTMSNKKTVLLFEKTRPGARRELCTITIFQLDKYTVIKVVIHPTK